MIGGWARNRRERALAPASECGEPDPNRVRHPFAASLMSALLTLCARQAGLQRRPTMIRSGSKRVVTRV